VNKRKCIGLYKNQLYHTKVFKKTQQEISAATVESLTVSQKTNIELSNESHLIQMNSILRYMPKKIESRNSEILYALAHSPFIVLFTITKKMDTI
jgi:hypothetical protein